MGHAQYVSTLVAAVVAGGALLAVKSYGPGSNLGSLGYFVAPLPPKGSLGPFSTQDNHGYESADQISPVVPKSYHAKRSPHLYAVQFIADSPKNLGRDDLAIRLASAGRPWPKRSLIFTAHGLAGYPVRSMTKSSVKAEFVAPLFDRPPSPWQVKVDDVRPSLPPISAYDRLTLQSLDAYRRLAGQGSLQYDQELALAAKAHARYLAENGYDAPSFHDEQRGRKDYTGAKPWDRDMAFGWPSELAGEVGIEWNQRMEPPIVIQNLIDTVYHRLDLLSDNLYREGQGTSLGRSGAMVMDLGFGYAKDLPRTVRYPYPGQVGVPIFWTDLESPDPMPGGFGKVYGYPITMDMPTAARMQGVSFSLLEGQRPLPAHVDRPNQGDMDANQAALVPYLPLPPDTVLTVRFSAEVVFQDGKEAAVHLSWQFATGGGAVSVTAIPQGGHRVRVAVASTGQGVALAGERVRIYRGRAMVASARTNRQGWADLNLPRGTGWYLAKTATGNAMAFKEDKRYG